MVTIEDGKLYAVVCNQCNQQAKCQSGKLPSGWWTGHEDRLPLDICPACVLRTQTK